MGRPGPNELPRWMYGDPAKVYERIEQAEQRAKSRKARIGVEQLFVGDAMTQDESEKIEDLLMVWYEYERRYRVALGAPRVSVSCRDHQPDAGDIHETGADRDDRLEQLTAEAVGACVDELPYQQRAAIGVHCRNRYVGVSVHRNPRIEDQHGAYQQAKNALFPGLKRRGLL